MSPWVLGVVGGSGLYDIDGLKDPRWTRTSTPWGDPSDALLTGTLAGVRLVFLPRHGRGHRLAPAEINARANIHALKAAGCTDVLSVSAVGSLKEELAPGAFVAVDQFIDRTQGRPSSFFDDGCVAHVSVADPVCPRLSGLAFEAAAEAGAPAALGGVYLAMQGPQFSTRAESRLYRSWGADVIGMTGLPEAKLAREAELPYASMCMVTDYDCWREGLEDVQVPDILRVLQENAARAKAMIQILVARLAGLPRSPSPIDRALEGAVLTARASMDPAAVKRLEVVAGRVMKAEALD